MNNKRLLSLLLSAVLASSCLQLTAIAAPLSVAEPLSVATLVESNGWLANSAEPILTDDTDGNGDGKYIHISSPTYLPMVGYKNSAVSLKANTKYQLSVWLRRSTDVICNDSDATVDIRVLLNYDSDNMITGPSGTNYAHIKPISITPTPASKGTITAYETWTEYKIVFETKGNSFALSGGGIIFRGASDYDDWASFDIDGMSLCEVEKTESGRYVPVENAINLVSGYLNASSYSSLKNGATAKVVDAEDFYHVAAGTVNTVITPAQSGELEAGVYTLTGDFRLSDATYDEIKNIDTTGTAITAELSATIGNISSSSASVNPMDWTAASFTFDLVSGGNLNDLELTLDSARAIDYKNLKLTFVPYEYNEEWEGNNGEGVRFYDDDIESYYKLESKGINTSETNYNISLLPNAANQFAAGKYEIAFSIRNDAANADASNTLELKLGNGYSYGYISNTGSRKVGTVEVMNVTSITKNGASYTGGSTSHSITADWTDYVISVDLKYGAYSGFRPNVEGLIFYIAGERQPVNIANISISKNGTEIDLSNYTFKGHTGYESFGDYPGKFEYLLGKHSTTAGSGIEKLVYVGSNDTVYNAGTYVLTGGFRASTATTISADIKGITASAEIPAGKLTDVELIFEMREQFTMKDITIDLGGTDIEFTSINFTGTELDISKNWATDNGKQVVYFKEPEEYIRLSADPNNLPDAGSAYCYDIIKLPAGTYTVSFKARVDKSAESTSGLKVVLGGLNAITSSWSVYRSSVYNATYAVFEYAKVDGNSYTTEESISLGRDWRNFDIKFTSKREMNFKFFPLDSDVAINVKDFVVLDAEGNPFGEYRFNTSADSDYGVKPGVSAKVRSHYTTAGTGASKLVYIGEDKTFAPGLYTFTTTLKSSEENAYITLAIKDSSIVASSSISEQWDNVTFEIDARESFKMSDVMFEFYGDLSFTEFEFSGDEYTFNDEWQGDNGVKMPYIDVGYDYIKLSADPDNMPLDVELTNNGVVIGTMSGTYHYDVVTLPAGAYTVSFKARLDKSAEKATSLKVLLGGLNNITSQWSLYRGDVYNTAYATIDYAKVNGNNYTDRESLALSTEWQLFEVSFTSHRELNFKLVPVDRDVSINVMDFTVLDADGNSIDTWRFDTSADTDYGAKPGISERISSYYTTKASGATAITPIAEKDCAPGLYKITGNFNAPTSGTLTATVNGKTYAEVSINESWRASELILDVREYFSLEDLKLEFDSEYLNFSEVKMTEEVYTTLDELVGNNGALIVKVEVDEPYQLLISHATGDASATGGYITQFQLASLPAGTYKFTADVRNTNTGSKNINNGFFAGINGWYSYNSIFFPTQANKYTTVKVNSASINGSPVDDQFPLLTDAWRTYESEFTVTANSRFYIAIYRNTGSDFNSVDFKNFSLVNVKTGAEIECAFNPVESGGKVKDIISHYTTRGSGAESISPAPGTASEYDLIAGKYYITGNFCATEDFAELTAYAGDAKLQTLSGNTGVKLKGDIWSKVTFVLDTVVDMSTTDIRLAFDGDIDFTDNIQIELIEKYYDINEIDMGTVITLLMLKKEVSDSYDPTNMLSGSIIRSTAGWKYGEQTLKFVKSNDGNYLAVRDRASNEDTIAYNPGLNLRAGMYVLSFELRTANPGETDQVRIQVGNLVSSKNITNAWRKIDIMVNVEKKTPFVLSFFGGPMATCIKDFDIRNIHMMNTDDIPGGFNLFQGGDFETEGTYGFTVPGPAKLNWMKEDGNGFLRVVGRDLNYTRVRNTLSFEALEGALYTISYDIRASYEGDAFTARAYINNAGLVVEDHSEDGENEYEITHEWKHVVSTYLATGKGTMVFDLLGGQNPDEDYKDFDIDNIVITKKGGATEDDMYPAGTFDDKGSALAGWYAGGLAKFTWNEENGDGYVTVSDRPYNYAGANLRVATLTAGTTYRISYDVRATHEGDELTVRAYVYNSVPLTVPGGGSSNGNEFDITHEWRHVESTFTAKEDGVVVFLIKGGQNPEKDFKDFDINNFTIGVAQ